MIPELLKIVKLCDRNNSWNEEEWIKTLTNCVAKGQYVLILEKKEIVGFSCWLFIKDLEKVDGKFLEVPDGKIAYILSAYVKEGHKGLLNKMLREGVERHPHATHIFYYIDRLNNKKVLIPVNKWRKQ